MRLSNKRFPTNNYARAWDGRLIFFNDNDHHQVDDVLRELVAPDGKVKGAMWRDPGVRREEACAVRLITICQPVRHRWFRPKDGKNPGEHCSRCGVAKNRVAA